MACIKSASDLLTSLSQEKNFGLPHRQKCEKTYKELGDHLKEDPPEEEDETSDDPSIIKKKQLEEQIKRQEVQMQEAKALLHKLTQLV
jgi:hypothetical protein